MIGTEIANYKITDLVGEGGMGVVYKAIDLNLNRPVAVKVLNSDLARNPELVERFRSEARAQANLNHTNLATLYSFLVVEGSAMMVMEFVDGETLAKMSYQRGPIPSQEMVPLFKQALLGIGYAHRMGIIHRDIKPSNLMVNRNGIVKVMDFGIAKVIGNRGMTRTGTQLGTAFYMSPEQVMAKPVDIRSDIYALGITLYEMLCGQVPFQGESDFRIMADHVNTAPKPPTQHYPYIPKGVENAVLQAIAKNPDERFQKVEDFGAALEHPEDYVASVQQPVSRAGSILEGSTAFLGDSAPTTTGPTAPGRLSSESAPVAVRPAANVSPPAPPVCGDSAPTATGPTAPGRLSSESAPVAVRPTANVSPPAPPVYGDSAPSATGPTAPGRLSSESAPALDSAPVAVRPRGSASPPAPAIYPKPVPVSGKQPKTKHLLLAAGGLAAVVLGLVFVNALRPKPVPPAPATIATGGGTGASLSAGGEGQGQAGGIPSSAGSGEQAPGQSAEAPSFGPILPDGGQPILVPFGQLRLLRHTLPSYPENALSSGITGTVTLKLWIDRAGSVQRSLAVAGNPVLVEPARQAVKGWQFAPYIANGRATAVVTESAVAFQPPQQQAQTGAGPSAGSNQQAGAQRALANAYSAMQGGRLVIPEGNNAVYFARQAQQLDPGNTEASQLEHSALIVALQTVHQLAQAGRLRDARTVYDGLVQLFPNNPQVTALGQEVFRNP